METNHLTLCSASAGSGKTYTLSAYYVGLLLSGVSHRSILAVTFTNKATNEMKSRILGFLYALSHGEEDTFLNLARTFMIAHQQDTDSELRKRAGELFEQMLEQFDDFHVMTIDTFLQSILSGMAQMLETNIGQNVELDIDKAITDAVDRMLTTELSKHEGLKNIIVDYMKEKMANEDNWDVRASMIRLIKNWYQESVQTLKGGICKDIDLIELYKKNLDWQKAKEVNDLRQKIQDFRTLYSEREIGSTYQKILNQLELSCNGQEISEKNAFKALGQNREKFPNKTFQQAFKKDGNALDAAVQLFLEIDDLANKCREIYLNHSLGSVNLNNLKLLSFISSQLDSDMLDANRWLLAKTATTLSEALKPGDADFILEKAGIRYHHILIDEFQDTSKLQWANFMPLMQELLSQEGGTALIVGDIKQSIYRWRNGDWHIMAGLKEEFGEEMVTDWPLSRNFRSQANVVRFNLETFRQITQEDTFGYQEIAQSIYNEQYTADSDITDFSQKANEDATAGYVQLRSYACHHGNKNDQDTAARYYMSEQAREWLLQGMFQDIANLHNAKHVPYKDMLILVKRNSETAAIRKAFAKYKRSLKIEDCELVSNQIYRLDSSQSVMTIVSALHFIENEDRISKAYLLNISGLNPSKLDQLKSLNRNMPLFELAQECINICLKNEKGDVAIKDGAYLNYLMDSIRDFVGSRGSDRRTFLNHWEEKIHEATIPPVGSNGIQIMSIHSAKGLENKTVFIPFCDWEQTSSVFHRDMLWCESAHDTTGNSIGFIPIKESESMKDCQTKYNGTESYRTHYERSVTEQKIDNLNVLYVALTRAGDNLYIYSVGVENLDKSDVGSLLRKIWKPTMNSLELKEHFQQEMEAVHTAYQQYIENGTRENGDDFEALTELEYFKTQMTPKAIYVEYTLGQPFINLKDKENNELFSFAGVKDTIQGEYFCNTEGIKFNQSQESLKYYESLAESDDLQADSSLQEDFRERGIICHEILSRIETAADKKRIIQEAESEGLIVDHKKEIEKMVDVAISRMSEWFDGSWQLLRETAILWPEDSDADETTQYLHREKRPDRVMIKGNKAIVLDWKFAAPKEEHKLQVKEYIADMKAMGYNDVEGYLWYGYRYQLVNVNE